MSELPALQRYVYCDNLPKDKNGLIEGHVTVEQSIHGQTIRAKGHVILMQECDASSVESELGSIFLMYGATKDSTFHAGMNLFIKHAENAALTAGKDIIIEDSVRNSRLHVGGKIISEALKGRVIGGEIEARDKVELAVLGSPAEIETRVSVTVPDGIILFKQLHPGVVLSVGGVSKALKVLEVKGGVYHKVFMEEGGLYITSVTREMVGDEIRYISADKIKRLVDE